MRSQSRSYRVIVRWLRAAFPVLGFRLSAAAAREIERSHALTDAHGNVYLRTHDNGVFRIPNENE